MGLNVLNELISKSNFPWLLSNVLDVDTFKPILNGIKTKLIVEIQNIKVNLFFYKKRLLKRYFRVNFKLLGWNYSFGRKRLGMFLIGLKFRRCSI